MKSLRSILGLDALPIVIVLGTAFTSAVNGSGSVPTRVALVSAKGEQLVGDNVVGDVQITFKDGHVQKLTSSGQSSSPQISTKGDVGWIDTSADKLMLRHADGKIEQVNPEKGFPYLLSWSFADGDSAIVLLCCTKHDIVVFVKHDIATGKITGRVNHPEDYNKLPDWAKRAARGHPFGSIQNVPNK